MSESLTSRFASRPSLPGWSAPVVILLCGLALLGLAAWPPSTHGWVGVPVSQRDRVTVTIPPRDRGSVSDWPAFFQRYNLRGDTGNCRVARSTLRDYVHTHRPALSEQAAIPFPQDGVITVVFDESAKPVELDASAEESVERELTKMGFAKDCVPAGAPG